MFWFCSLVFAQPILPRHQKDGSEDLQRRRSFAVEAVQSAAPSVVSITTEIPNNNAFAWFYGEQTSSADGSGVVVEESGIVLTNAHVVEQASRIEAHFLNGDSYSAQLIGMAQELDLAVLQLEAPKSVVFSSVEIGTSSDLMLGESVIAIGNPLGLGLTVTTGVISATSRVLETERRIYQDFLQTDASINPGNSGGPLLDINARLIGINTAIRADAQNIGFAIPVDRAIKVAQDLLTYGEVKIPWLGVDLEDVFYRTASGRAVGPHVQTVWSDNGLQKEDIILSVDGRSVSGRGDLNTHLAVYQQGKVVSLEVLRAGQIKKLQIQTSEIPDQLVDRVISKVLGAQLKEQQGYIFIASLAPSGAFALNRLRVGDAIVAFNGAPVSSVDQLLKMMAQAKSEHRASAYFTIRRGNAQGVLEVPI